VEELVSTRVKDVDIQEGLILLQVSRTKTRQYRSVVVPSDVLPQLEVWILSLPRDTRWLFPGQGGDHITVRRVRQIVHQAAEEAGVQRVYGHDKNGRPLYAISSHTPRHAHAITALDADVLLNDLQAQLGHSNLATMSVYLNANLEHRKKAYERAKFGLLD